MKMGKKPPSVSKITDMLAKKMEKDKTIENEYINF